MLPYDWPSDTKGPGLACRLTNLHIYIYFTYLHIIHYLYTKNVGIRITPRAILCIHSLPTHWCIPIDEWSPRTCSRIVTVIWVNMKHENHIYMSRRKPLLMIMISHCRCPVCRVSVSDQCCRSSLSLWSGYIPLANMFILLAYINNCQLRNNIKKTKSCLCLCVLSLNKEKL